MTPPTLATASKRSIRREISAHRMAHRKDLREARAAASAFVTALRKLSRQKLQLETRTLRNSEAVLRRIAILQGRL